MFCYKNWLITVHTTLHFNGHFHISLQEPISSYDSQSPIIFNYPHHTPETGQNHNMTRDVHETFWAETKTRPETHVSETETFKILSKTRCCSFWDAGRDLEAPETLESLGSFNVLPRCFPWCMVKHIDNEKNYMD